MGVVGDPQRGAGDIWLECCRAERGNTSGLLCEGTSTWRGRGVRHPRGRVLPGRPAWCPPVVFGRQQVGSHVSHPARPRGVRWMGRGAGGRPCCSQAASLPPRCSKEQGGEEGPGQASRGPRCSVCALRVLCDKPGPGCFPPPPLAAAELVPGRHSNWRASSLGQRWRVEGGQAA